MNRNIVQAFFKRLYLVMFFLLLAGCETEKIQQTNFVSQQNLFLQSLELVESAGSLLQGPNLEKKDIDLAMKKMDLGLEKAFRVEVDFLNQLDLRLAKLYRDRFIEGVEQYRIGFESASREQQLQGLNLLKQWSEFWLDEKARILLKIVELTGEPAVDY